MSTAIKLRGDTTINWATNSSVILAEREVAVDTTLNQIKIGDGVSTWSTLPFATPKLTNPDNGEGNYASASAMVTALAVKAPIVNIASTVNNYAPIDNPTFTGTVTLPSTTPTENTYQAATTKYVDAKVSQGITSGVQKLAPSEDVVYSALLNKTDLVILSQGTSSTPPPTVGLQEGEMYYNTASNLIYRNIIPAGWISQGNPSYSKIYKAGSTIGFYDGSKLKYFIDVVIKDNPVFTGNITISGIPTSASGLTSGMIWSNSGVLTIVE